MHSRWDHERPYWIRSADGTLRRATSIEWAEWCEKNPKEKFLRRDDINPDLWVSTVFLGIDHGWMSPIPVLYETMVFRRRPPEADNKVSPIARFPFDGLYQWRFCYEQSALRAHEYVCNRLREDPNADLSEYEPVNDTAN